MEGLLKVADAFDGTARRVGKGAGWLILPLITIIIFDVVTRKIDFIRIYFAGITQETGFAVSFILQDLEWHIHGVLLLLTFGYGYLMNAHVRVDVIREHLPKRIQAWMEFWGLLLMGLPYLILLLYFSWIFVALSFSQGEGSESLTGIPKRYIVKTFLIVGFAVMLMAAIAVFIRTCTYLFGSPSEKAMVEPVLMIFPAEVVIDPDDELIHEIEEEAAEIAPKGH